MAFLYLLDKFTAFNTWCDKIDSSMDIKEINVTSVTWFGPKVGLLYLDCIVTTEKVPGNLPGAVFMRGGSVGMLPVIRNTRDGLLYTALTVQARVAAGALNFVELPAGMIDNGSFAGSAAKEINEELSLDIKAGQLHEISPDYSSMNLTGLYPSAGGCDEAFKLYAFFCSMDGLTFDAFKKIETGQLTEGETIMLKLVPLDDNVCNLAADFKLSSAMYFYQLYVRKKSINVIAECDKNQIDPKTFEEAQRKRNEKKTDILKKMAEDRARRGGV